MKYFSLEQSPEPWWPATLRQRAEGAMREREGRWLVGVRTAAALAVAAPALAGLISVVVGLLTPGYNPARASISVLGGRGEPYALVMNGGFLVLGAAVIALAWALHRSLDGRAAGATRVLAAGGAGIIALALISRDPAAPVVTAVHRALAAAALLALAASPPLVAVALRHDPGRWGLVLFSSAVGLVSAVQLLAGAVLVALGRFPAGALERSFAGADLMWVMVVAILLLRGSRPSAVALGSQ